MDRRSFLLLSSSFVLAQLAGCGDDGADNQASNTTARAAGEPEAARLSEQEAQAIVRAGRRYRVAVLFPFQGIPFWVNEAFGIFDQGAKSGIDLIWRSADGYENVDRQVAQIAEMKALGVDAVLLGATSAAGTRAAVEDLIASGTPVVNHVTSTASPRVSSRVLVDYADIGRRQAAFLKRARPNGGPILMLSGPAGAEWSTNEVDGFKRELGQNAPWRIAAERNSNPDRVAAQRFMDDLKVRFPDAVGCFSVTDSLAMGAMDALGAAAGRQTLITTAGFSPETVEPIRAGRIALNVDESPVLIGRAAVNAVVRLLNGERVAGRQFVPTPEHTAESLRGGVREGQWAPQGWSLP